MVKIGPLNIGTTTILGLVIAVPIIVGFVKAGGFAAAQRFGRSGALGLGTLATVAAHPVSAFLCAIGIPVKITDPQYGPIGGDFCAAVLGSSGGVLPGAVDGERGDGRPPEEPPADHICTAAEPCPPTPIVAPITPTPIAPATDCYEYALPGEAGGTIVYVDRITGRTYATMAECQGGSSFL